MQAVYSQVGTTVVISQVYGAGGNSGAAYQNDFVELFNPTPSAQSLDGWSVQYASATGTSWQVVSLPNFSLQPGQYFLVKLTSGGATGAPLPTEDVSGSINMSGTNGKVALVNSTSALSSCLPNAAIIDLVGYGTANCFEGAAAAPVPGGNTNSVQRLDNGCRDSNNNGADVVAGAANPRNSSSPTNTCGAASAVLFAQPGSFNNITTSVGTASAVSSYALSGSTLSPAAGNITVSAGSGLEVSLNAGGPFGASVLVPYTGGALSATTIFFRISASAAQGAFAGAITNAGGGASDVLVNVTGGVFQSFFNTKANLGLNNLGTWSATLNGSGASPAAFTDPYQLFNIVNQANANYSGVWNVSATGNTARIVVGDGVSPITFTVLPGADSVTIASRIDIRNNGTLVLQNNSRPFLNTIETGSTVDYAQSGLSSTDTIRVPALNYFNLKFTNGYKYLATGTTTVRGNLILEDVVSMNGATSSVSKINLFGNLICNGQVQFDANEAGRFSIGMNGTGTQSIEGNLNEIKLFRLQRDTTTSPLQINVAAGTVLTLGAPGGGGLQLNQSGANTTVLNLGSSILTIQSAGFFTTSSTGTINSLGGTININKSAGNGNAGNLRFSSGAILNALNINFDPAFARDSVILYDTVTVQSLVLNKGKLVVNSNTDGLVDIPQGGSVTGGSATAYVDGLIRRSGTGSISYPVGNAGKYAPVQVAVTAGGLNSYTVRYFFTGFGSYAIDANTLANFPDYDVSRFEYWTIDQANPGTANLTFSFTDAGSQLFDLGSLRVAHYDGADWDDLGGTITGGSTLTNGSITVTNVSTFSPFTLSALQLGVIPVKLEYIRGQRSGSTHQLNWKVTCTGASVNMEIQRSSDARSFSAIGNINATQARCAQPFDFADALPLAGNNFYRLKMTDIDGKVTYSPVVLINGESRGFSVVGIYPSVVRNSASISISASEAANVEMVITDMAGRVHQRSRTNVPSGSSLLNLDAATLAGGYYNVTIISKGNTQTIRFLKQ